MKYFTWYTLINVQSVDFLCSVTVINHLLLYIFSLGIYLISGPYYFSISLHRNTQSVLKFYTSDSYGLYTILTVDPTKNSKILLGFQLR